MGTQIDETTRAAILADYVGGTLSVREIATKYGVSRQTPVNLAQDAKVPGRLREGGLPTVLPDPPALPITTPAAFRQARESLGKTTAMMADELGVSQRTVRSWEQDPILTDHPRTPNPAAMRYLEHMLKTRFPDAKRT